MRQYVQCVCDSPPLVFHWLPEPDVKSIAVTGIDGATYSNWWSFQSIQWKPDTCSQLQNCMCLIRCMPSVQPGDSVYKIHFLT